MKATDEFSFVLKPSAYGVGVFAVHDIAKGTHLRLFGSRHASDTSMRECAKADVPETFRDFCIDREDVLYCPADFGRMHIGWYVNHSQEPNAYSDDEYQWYALRDIGAGEEILVDYNELNEPEGAKDEYYAH